MELGWSTSRLVLIVAGVLATTTGGWWTGAGYLCCPETRSKIFWGSLSRSLTRSLTRSLSRRVEGPAEINCEGRCWVRTISLGGSLLGSSHAKGDHNPTATCFISTNDQLLPPRCSKMKCFATFQWPGNTEIWNWNKFFVKTNTKITMAFLFV